MGGDNLAGMFESRPQHGRQNIRRAIKVFLAVVDVSGEAQRVVFGLGHDLDHDVMFTMKSLVYLLVLAGPERERHDSRVELVLGRGEKLERGNFSQAAAEVVRKGSAAGLDAIAADGVVEIHGQAMAQNLRDVAGAGSRRIGVVSRGKNKRLNPLLGLLANVEQAAALGGEHP